MLLSPHFSLDELKKSHTAIRLGIDNSPDENALNNLKLVSLKILEPIREYFNIPFSPSSGFRSKQLNKIIGSKETSSHIMGQAVDFEIPSISNPILAEWVKSNLVFDQLILEHFCKDNGQNSGWVHVSFKEGNNRNEILTINKSGVFPGLFY